MSIRAYARLGGKFDSRRLRSEISTLWTKLEARDISLRDFERAIYNSKKWRGLGAAERRVKDRPAALRDLLDLYHVEKRQHPRLHRALDDGGTGSCDFTNFRCRPGSGHKVTRLHMRYLKELFELHVTLDLAHSAERTQAVFRANATKQHLRNLSELARHLTGRPRQERGKDRPWISIREFALLLLDVEGNAINGDTLRTRTNAVKALRRAPSGSDGEKATSRRGVGTARQRIP